MQKFYSGVIITVMAVQNLEITTENILSAVVKMPESEFKKLFSNAKKLRQSKSEKQKNTEIKLIQKINKSILSDDEQNRFDKLVEKRRAENISKSELSELIALTEKSEELNVKRLRYLSEIASLQSKNLREVMKELEISIPQII